MGRENALPILLNVLDRPAFGLGLIQTLVASSLLAGAWTKVPYTQRARLCFCPFAVEGRGSHARVSTKPIMVLVVDDDASVRKALRRLFHATGYDVETFATAAAFLAFDLPPDAACVVLDIRMPGISGLDLQAQLTVLHPELPVIVITGHGDDEVRQLALTNGAVAFLEKPFDDQSLLDAVELAMQRRTSP